MALTDEEIENEPQHVTYIDELLWLLEEAERGKRLSFAKRSIKLEHVMNSMSDGIADWLEDLKEVLLCKSPVKEEDISNLHAIRDMLVDQMDIAVADWHVDELESWRQSLNDVLAHLASK